MLVKSKICHVILSLTAWAVLMALAVATRAAETRSNSISETQAPVGHVAEPKDKVQPIKTPTDAAGWHKRGRDCLEHCSWEEAIAAFDQAILKSPKNAASYYFRAIAKERLNKIQDALDDYVQAIRLRPSWGSACLRRGNLLVRTGEVKQGMAEQKKAFRLGKFR